METIDSLKDKKAADNRLVILNPVTEDLNDVIEVKRVNTSSADDIIEVEPPRATPVPDDDIVDITEPEDDVVIEAVRPATVNQALPLVKQTNEVMLLDEEEPGRKDENVVVPGVSGTDGLPSPAAAALKPTAEESCNQSAAAVDASPISQLAVDASPKSQLDEAIASISAATSSVLNPSKKSVEKVSNPAGGVGFLELDQAIASIADLQEPSELAVDPQPEYQSGTGVDIGPPRGIVGEASKSPQLPGQATENESKGEC